MNPEISLQFWAYNTINHETLLGRFKPQSEKNFLLKMKKKMEKNNPNQGRFQHNTTVQNVKMLQFDIATMMDIDTSRIER